MVEPNFGKRSIGLTTVPIYRGSSNRDKIQTVMAIAYLSKFR